MIAFISGKLVDVTENTVIIESQGVGYEVFVPGTVNRVLPKIGGDLKLHTYLQVKEDGVALFGFATKDDLKIFKLLITVNGIGPKGAIGILSVFTADDLRFAILAEDDKAIAKAPGIGKKTAGKLILELKDKFKLEDAFEQKLANSMGISDGPITDDNQMRDEALQALVALGYSASDAMRALKRVEITEGMSVENLLKQSLKKIG